MEILKITEYNWINKFGIIKLDETTSKYFNNSQNIKKNLWVPDNSSTNCFECQTKFSTFLVRQHHCRICGNIFCNNCSLKKIQTTVDNKIINLRVCNNCFNICKNFSIYIEKKFFNDEIKEYTFCNNYEKLKINNNKFLKFEKIENEKIIKNNINTIYELIIKNFIKNILDEYFSKLIVEEWEKILFSLTKEVINNLKINSLFLNDSLNINRFIKIKIVPYKDNSKCKVIPGFVMKSKIFSKNLKTSFIGPKILLINQENDLISKKLDDYLNSFQRSNAYIKIIEKKLEILNPDIILIGRNYPKLLLNNLINNNSINNKCYIFDIKKKSFQDIARCTQNIIIPSFDLLGTDNVLGKCKNFYIKKIDYNFKIQKENKKIYKIEKDKKEDNYLIVFEGSNSLLFNTILLTGEDQLFLKKIKNLLKNVLLPSIRDLFLQKYLLYFFNMNIIGVQDINEKDIYNIFEENKNFIPKELIQDSISIKDFYLKNSIELKNNNNKELKLRQTYEIFDRLLTKDNKPQRKISKKMNKSNKELSSNLFYRGFDLSIICKKSEYINYSVIRISRTIKKSNNYNQVIEENNLEYYDDDEINYSLANRRLTMNTNMSRKIKEKNVHKNIGKYCTRPTKFFFSFYCDNKAYDMPLGRFIFELGKESKTNCDICGDQLSSHIHHLYKSNGRIKIKLISDKENLLEIIIKYLEKNEKFKIINKIEKENDSILDIYSYGYCNICKDITTPLFKLSNEILNYSTSKFFRFFLENLNIENNIREYDYNIKNLINHNKCNHYINKDISRIFISKYGTWLFEYNSIYKYFISPLDINSDKTNKNSLGNNNFIEEYRNEANINSKTVLDMISNLFQKQISGLENHLNDEKLYLFKSNINLLINIIIMTIRLIEEFKSNVITKYLSKEYISSNKGLNLLRYIVIIKKIYIKIIQIKILANAIDNFIIELNVISGILNRKLPISYEENINLLQGKNEDIPFELQLFDIKVDKTPTININFENNQIYLKMISFIEFYDDNHNNYSCEFFNHDLSCLISTVLSSDDYLNFIKKENKNGIQFSNIKCKRVPNTLNYDNIRNHISLKKNNVSYINLYEKKQKKELEESEIKEEIKKNKAYYDDSLIFNLSKNNYYINNNNSNIDNEKEILEYLEKELNSNEKEEFNYIISNNFTNFFDNINHKNFSSSFKKEKEEKKENNEEKEENKLFINDIAEINDTNKEMKNIKNKLLEFNNLFIGQQRELNIVIKSLLIPKIKKKTSFFSRKYVNSFKNLYEDMNDGIMKKSLSRKSSVSSKSSSEDEYESKSFEAKNDDLFDILNEANNSQSNVIPSFPFIPEFLKIFELKKTKYYEEEILEKKYPEFKIKVYFPHQFEALRTTYCATNEEFIESIKKSFEWSVTGGKSNANFFKTYDNKYIIKSISEMEFNMFLESALNYFKHISKYLFHRKSSAIGKILGAYNVKIKIPGEKEKNYYLIIMENIYYGMLTNINNNTFNSPESNIMVYDLKGSKINRYVQQQNRKPGKVLLDTNFLEDFNGEPLFLDINVFQLFQKALKNDSQFLKNEGVIDYSLLIIFEGDNNTSNNNKKEMTEDKNFKLIRLGIIDYLRKYTWDKQLESYSKKFINGFANPTIINPDSYSQRFMEKIQRYFIGI